MKKLILSVIVCLLLVGCTTASYSPSRGISYSNFFFQKQFSEMSINTNGTVSIKGYQSEAASLIKASAEGVALGLSKGLVP